MRSKKPNILLITADSLRADYCGPYNKDSKNLTPYLDKIANEGMLFVNAYANAPYTTLSIPAIMTGKLPLFNSTPLPGQRITIPEYLRIRGYLTIGIISNNPFAKFYSGNGRGFVIFHEIKEEKTYHTKLLKELLRTTLTLRKSNHVSRIQFLNLLSQLVLDTLSSKRTFVPVAFLYSLTKLLVDEVPLSLFYPKYDIKAIDFAERVIRLCKKEYPKRPIFLWLHLMSTHMPYSLVFEDEWEGYWRWLPRRSFITALLKSERYCAKDIWKLRSIYKDGVRQFDRLLKRVFEILDENGLLDNCYAIITADHGDELLEEGDFGHKCKLIDEVLRIPMILWGTEERKHIKAPASSSDIFPTILNIVKEGKGNVLEKELARLFDGESLLENHLINRNILSECIMADERLFMEIMIGKRVKVPFERNPPKIRVTTSSKYKIFTQKELEQKEPCEEELLDIAKKRYWRMIGIDHKDRREELIYKALRGAFFRIVREENRIGTYR